MSRGGGLSRPGAVKITLHSNNNELGEKAEVTVAVKNPDNAVERMLRTLAQRFPPESVVTIAPAQGLFDGSGASSSSSSAAGGATSTEGSRTSSSSFSGETSGGPTLALSPSLRRGMATLSPELSGWVLANNPVIFPGLLDLVTRGGDPKEFAARMGLSPEPVETVVLQLAQDADFFEWMTQLANAASPPARSGPRKGGSSTKPPSGRAIRRAQTQPVRGQMGYPAGLPPPAVGMVLKDPNFPKQGYWLVDHDGQVVGHSDAEGHHVLHPLGSLGRDGILYPYAPHARPELPTAAVPRDLGAFPKDALHPEEGSWLVNREGRVVGHTNSAGRVVMHPVSDLSSRPSQPSGFAGLNVVPRDPAHAEDGGPWLVDSTGSVVGHYDQKGRPVMHPIVLGPSKLPPLPSPIPGLMAVAINPRKPAEGSWLLDRSHKIVGHTDTQNSAIMHPQTRLPMSDIKSSGVPELHMVPRDPKHPEHGGPWLVDKHGAVIGHYDRERRPVMHPADAVSAGESATSSRFVTSRGTDPVWLRDASGKVVGHMDGARQVMHPPHPLPMAQSRSSGLPGVWVVPKDGARREPWLVDASGTVVGHYDPDGRVVLHPSLQPPSSPVAGLTMQPITPSRPLEGSWLLNADGKIVGHTDPSNRPIFHPERPLSTANGRPSGLPGISVIPREPSRPDDGGPWLVDASGTVVGHYDPDGRAVLQPAGAEGSEIDFDLPLVPLDPSNPRGPAWVVDSSSGLVIGHVEQPHAAPVHYVGAATSPARPTGVPGLSVVDSSVPWLVDSRSQLLGHISPEGLARFHPLLPTVPPTAALRVSGAGPNLRELPMDGLPGSVWLLDALSLAVVGHQTAGAAAVMHPTVKFASTQPTAISGLRRMPRGNSGRRVSWACDDEGFVLGHFQPDTGSFLLHPRSPRAATALTEVPKDPDHPELGSWLLSREGMLLGHTDAADRPIRHPQRAFPRSASVPVGIAGISLVSRDPQHPELGGPWLVGEDGVVVGHFEPEGRPLLHPNFTSRLSQLVPSPVAGFSAAYINPERPADGVWLLDADGQVVGHATLDGSAQVHPQGPLVPNVASSLRGLAVAQRDPLNPHFGGPWVLDANNQPVAHYAPDGRLVLHPPPRAASPPHSVVSAPPQPSRTASSAGKYSLGSNWDENGNRVRIVEVPVVEERVKEVLKKEVREVERRVPKIVEQVVEKIVEVPEIRYVERRVSKEVIEEVVRHVPKKEIIDVPKEVIVEVPRLETRVIEKIVEKPEIIEVPKPYKVEQRVNVPRYVNAEKPTIVAQKLRPIVREATTKQVVQAKTYEPMLYAVDVYIPKPVQSAFTSLGKADETHGVVEIPAPQYNSLLKAMNPGKPDEALNDVYVRGTGGVVPFLPVGELAEIVPPLTSAGLPVHLRPKAPRERRRHRSSPPRRHHRASRR